MNAIALWQQLLEDVREGWSNPCFPVAAEFCFRSNPSPRPGEQESPRCGPAPSSRSHPPQPRSCQGDGCIPWGTRLALRRTPQSITAKQTFAVH